MTPSAVTLTGRPSPRPCTAATVRSDAVPAPVAYLPMPVAYLLTPVAYPRR